MKNKISFVISNNSVTHLGRNLYSTTPPALAELVANSYDAYATEVYIIIKENKISIIDNGKGMDLEEIQSKYANIGQEKEEEKPINNLKYRKPMGKKGIGKLAAFSLGEKYTIFSKAINQKKWISMSLNYKKLKESNLDSYDVEYTECELPDYLEKYSDFKSGFIVIIEELRRDIRLSTLKNISTQLSRRFYIEKSKTDFKLFINDEQIDLSVNDYYNDLEYLTYFGYSEDEIKSLFSNSNIQFEEYNIDYKTIEYIENSKIKGWIGSVERPVNLKKNGNNFKNIIVYINNKIADENILKNKSRARIAEQYIVGEIQANYLNQLEDPITSSRQGLDDSIKEIIDFIDNIEKIRDYVIKKWNVIREDKAFNKLPEEIKNNKSFQDWLDSLNSEEKKIGKKLASFLIPDLDNEEITDYAQIKRMMSSIANVINSIELNKIEKSINENETEIGNLLDLLLTKVAKKEDIQHVTIIQERLKAIKHLEKLMKLEDDVKEKLFQEHLFENPWLIKPYWNKDNNCISDSFEAEREKYFRSINKINRKNEEYRKNFIDIYIRTAEEKHPIIVELKKNNPSGYANVTYSKIYDQIDKYRNAIIENRTGQENIESTDIKAIFILSEKIKFKDKELKFLKDDNIEIFGYDELLQNARRVYSKHLIVNHNKKIIPFIEEIEMEDDF